MKEKKHSLSMKIPQDLFDDIDAEAKKKNVSRTEIVIKRLQHYSTPLTPELMVELQNKANKKCDELKQTQPEEAIKIQKEVMKLWKHLS